MIQLAAASFSACTGHNKCHLGNLTAGAHFQPFNEDKARYNECANRRHTTTYDHTAMPQIFHPLLALIVSATDRELAKYVEYLKQENKILRARIGGEIHTKPEERERLLKYGKAIGRAIEELICIVTPATFYRWCKEAKKGKPQTAKPKGGQRKPKELRALVIQIAITTGFGYTRIIGELRKLGIKKISRQTVRNILKEEGIQPGPDRTSDCWDNFIERHAKTLWGCDFFSVKTVTSRGLRDMYLLVFLCLETREAIVSESTLHPNSAWVEKQAEVFVERTAQREKKPEMILHERDLKFTKEFTQTVKDAGMKTNPLPKGSPNLNGYVACCTSFVRLDRTSGNRRRSDSLCPWLLTGAA
jgi:putative transposase